MQRELPPVKIVPLAATMPQRVHIEASVLRLSWYHTRRWPRRWRESCGTCAL